MRVAKVMWGRQVNDSRRAGFWMALGSLGIVMTACLVVLLTHRWLVSDSPQSKSSEIPSEALPSETEQNPSRQIAISPTITPSPVPIPSQGKPSVPGSVTDPAAMSAASADFHSSRSTATSEGSATAVRQGELRISNPTGYPVRVALLAKKPEAPSSGGTTSGYDLPAHWDFAPQEGGTKGLIVSLPNRNLKVQQGDILVAFAQDGSRRYWGPYVIGETALPTWNTRRAEWELILQP